MSEVDISAEELDTTNQAEIEAIGNDGIDMVDEDDFDEVEEQFSSVTEDGDGDTDDDISDEGETPDEETSEDAQEDTSQETPEEGDTQPDEKQTEDEQKTDPIKGTKLDNDPLTAANQQLANTRTALFQAQQRAKVFEQVLQNPEALKALIAKRTGEEYAPAPKQEQKPAFQVPEKKYNSVEQLKTPEDVFAAIEERDKIMRAEVANALASELGKMQKTIQGFEAQKQQEMQAFRQREQTIKAASSAVADIQQAAKDYDWLNESSPNFNPTLREIATKEYAATDYDPKTKQYLGKRKFSDIVANLDAVIKTTSERATAAAKTTLVDKTAAQPKAGRPSTPQRKEKMSPESFIAAQIRNAQRGKRRGK